ncbi:hypothetical protein ACU8KH_01294 [Lachancea thermotolerans]
MPVRIRATGPTERGRSWARQEGDGIRPPFDIHASGRAGSASSLKRAIVDSNSVGLLQRLTSVEGRQDPKALH